MRPASGGMPFKFLFASTAFVMMTAQSVLAKQSKHCPAIVETAQQAADRADWVIEGDVTDTFRIGTTPGKIDVTIENAKVLYESERSPRFFTAALAAEPCLLDGETRLWGKAASKLTGKRMRFFGTRLTSGGGRRFFFMQAADQAPPALGLPRRQYVDAKHAPVVTAEGPDGWLRVRSTQGAYSIELPGDVTDITKGSSAQPAFLLRGRDRSGTAFIVVFERAGPGAELAGTHDEAISAPYAKKISFMGAEAVSTRDVVEGSGGAKISHGLWFRVPGGTYMLGIVADKADEASVLKLRDRFFHSLTFE